MSSSILWRLYGCKEDYEPRTPEHPFNNYNCKKYSEIHFITHEVVELKLIDKVRIAFTESSLDGRNLRDELLKKRLEEQKSENKI